eukprot:COSAG02_NODE_5071_length_4668_cov_3.398555_5_plen_156_part_00
MVDAHVLGVVRCNIHSCVTMAVVKDIPSHNVKELITSIRPWSKCLSVAKITWAPSVYTMQRSRALQVAAQRALRQSLLSSLLQWPPKSRMRNGCCLLVTRRVTGSGGIEVEVGRRVTIRSTAARLVHFCLFINKHSRSCATTVRSCYSRLLFRRT